MGGIRMDYIIKYWKEKETNPVEFLNHFRCTTEPIGGGTEHDDDGELVHYDAAIAAISIAEKAIIKKACEWLKENLPNRIYDRNCCLDNFTEYLIEDLRKYLEE